MEGAAQGGGGASRINALLDTIRIEIQASELEGQAFKQQRDDYERKFEAHLQELNKLHNALSELERTHVQMTQQYEAEILSLRRQVEAAGGKVQQGSLLPNSSGVQMEAGSSAGNSSFLLGGADTSNMLANTQLAPTTAAMPQGMLPMGMADSAALLGNMGMGGALGRAGDATAVTSATAASMLAPSRLVATHAGGGAGGAMQQQQPQQPQQQQQSAASQAAAILAGAGAGTEQNSSKPLNSRGKPMEEWNVVTNPTCSQKVSLKLEYVLQHDSVVCCVHFSRDGRYFASGCNKTASLFDVQTGRKVCMFVNDQAVETDAELEKALAANVGADSYVRSVSLSPDSSLLVAGTEDKTIKIWDLATRRLRHSLKGHTKDIYSVDCCADGKLIASGSGDKTAKLWDVQTGACVRTFGNEDGPKDGVTSVAVSPDGKYLAAGSLNKIVRVWDCETGQLAETFDGHEDSVYSVSFSPDGTLLATGSLDKTVRLWDLSNVGKRSPGKKCKFTFKGHNDFVLSVAFAPQGNWLISGSKDRSVQFWEPRMLREKLKTDDTGPSLILQGHQNSVISLAHSPVGNLFATGSGDKSARIWRYTSE